MSEMSRDSVEPAGPVEGAGPQGQPAPTASAPTPAAAAGGFTPPPGDWLVPAPGAAYPARHVWRWIIAGALVAMLAAVGSGVGIGWGLASVIHRPSVAQTATNAPSSQGSSGNSSGQGTGSLDADAIAARVDPAIVDVNTVLLNGTAAGTGIIVTSSGEVLTNNHVVDGSTSIDVTMSGRTHTYTAHVVGVDPSVDVALIQIDNVSGLPTVSLGDSSTLQVGDKVVALGNALGQGGAPSITQGAITALDQSITASEGGSKSEALTGMIESDAQISPGDSGGPLVNSAGKVVGIVTAGTASGFRTQVSLTSYAIPINSAMNIVRQIRAGQGSSEIFLGQVGFLGVSVQDVDSATAAQLGLNVSEGALVRSVQSGSPAEKAGIARFAVIVSAAGSQITSAGDLGPALHVHKPGDQVSVTWVDHSGTHTATVTLTTGPAV